MNNKLKIITSFFPPEKGAASHRILTTAKELNSYGFEVSVITTLANYPTGKLFKGYKKKLWIKEEIEGIECIRCWVYPSNSNNPILRVFSMLSYCFSLLFTIPSLIISKPKLMLVQTPHLLPALTGVIISKLLNVKVILNVSDIWPLTAVELGVMRRESILFKLFTRFESLLYRYSNAFITQSEETSSYLKQKSKKPILLYRNLTKPNFSKIVFSKKLNLKKKIVYAGLLGFAQGVLNICKNIDFKSLDIEFHIYGDGVERDLIERYISKNLDCNIYLRKSLSKEKMQEKLLSYDATIIPLTKNIYGAFPSKITMAMAAGLPIFFSGDGEGAKLVNKFKLGYVSRSGDLDGLNKNIIEFSQLKHEQINLMRQNIVNVIEKDFNYNDQQFKLYKFVSSIV